MAQETYHPVKNGDIDAGAVTATSITSTGAYSGTTVTATTSLSTDTVSERTSAAGVTVDGVLLKDTAAYGRTPVVAAAADGAVAITAYNQVVFITKGTAAALTLADPTATTHDGVTLVFVATTAAAHTVSNAAGSGFFSSGGASKDVATLGGAIGDGFAVIAYAGKWYIDPRGVTNATLG